MRHEPLQPALSYGLPTVASTNPVVVSPTQLNPLPNLDTLYSAIATTASPTLILVLRAHAVYSAIHAQAQSTLARLQMAVFKNRLSGLGSGLPSCRRSAERRGMVASVGGSRAFVICKAEELGEPRWTRFVYNAI